MHVVATIILVVWIAFWVYWFVAAVGRKAGHIRWGQFAGFRLAMVVIFVLVVRAHAFRVQTITDNPWRQTVGLALFLAGLAFAVWARLSIGRNWGSPMSEKVDPELIRTGPYHWVRHPIYTGIVLALVGTAIAVSWYWLIVAALLAGYFAYSATMEERYMRGQFPDAYGEYQRATKMFVPFVI